MYKKALILSIAFLTLFIAINKVVASENTQLYGYFVGGTQRFTVSSTSMSIINSAVSALSTTTKEYLIYAPPPQSVGTYSPTNWPSCTNANLNTIIPYLDGSRAIDNPSNGLWYLPSNGTTYLFIWSRKGTYTPYDCQYTDPIGYITINYNSGGSSSPSPDYEADLSTRVVRIFPNDVDDPTQATSTNFELWSLININNDDWIADNDWYLRFKYIRQEDLQLAVANTDLLYTEVDVPLTTWPNFDIISATTSIEREGVYLYTVQIRTPSVINSILGWFNLNNLYDPGLVAEKTGSFIVGQRTRLDQYIFDMASSTSALLSDPGTFDEVADNCNPISGFSLFGCISGLLVPNQTQISTAVDTLKSNILTKAPVGYVTRLVDIVASTGTTTLPDISYTFGSGPLEGQNFHFEPSSLLASADTIIRNDLVTDQDEPENLWDIFMPYWNILVYVSLLFMIVSEVTGMYQHGKHKNKHT